MLDSGRHAQSVSLTRSVYSQCTTSWCAVLVVGYSMWRWPVGSSRSSDLCTRRSKMLARSAAKRLWLRCVAMRSHCNSSLCTNSMHVMSCLVSCHRLCSSSAACVRHPLTMM